MKKKVLIIDNERSESDVTWSGDLKNTIQAIADVEVSVLHHSKISSAAMAQIKPDYLIAYGRVTHHWDMEEIMRDYTKELELLKTTKIPTLGICAGLQLMAIAHGTNIGRMVETPEDDILELGFHEVTLQEKNPIFEGLSESILCYEFHRDEVKAIPAGFELLASSSMCRVQMVQKIGVPVYGTQFHPEKFDEEHPAGRILLKNFLQTFAAE